MTNESKLVALKELLATLIEAMDAAGELGLPAGPLYATLMSFGCSLEHFELLMSGLIDSGLLRHSNHCYFITPKGKIYLEGRRK